MQCNEAPSSMHPLIERAARWRGPFIANWPWQSLIESRFLPLHPSLQPRRQKFLPPLSLQLLHLSFISSDWHVQSMCFLFPAWEVSVTLFHLFLCPSCLSPLSAFLSLSLLSLPQQDEDICHAPLIPVCVLFLSLRVPLCFLSVSLSFPPSTEGWRRLSHTTAFSLTFQSLIWHYMYCFMFKQSKVLNNDFNKTDHCFLIISSHFSSFFTKGFHNYHLNFKEWDKFRDCLTIGQHSLKFYLFFAFYVAVLRWKWKYDKTKDYSHVGGPVRLSKLGCPWNKVVCTMCSLSTFNGKRFCVCSEWLHSKAVWKHSHLREG